MPARKTKCPKRTTQPARHTHGKKPTRFRRIMTGLFNSVVAPLLVGIALQTLKGCDPAALRSRPQPTSSAAVAGQARRLAATQPAHPGTPFARGEAEPSGR